MGLREGRELAEAPAALRMPGLPAAIQSLVSGVQEGPAGSSLMLRLGGCSLVTGPGSGLAVKTVTLCPSRGLGHSHLLP